MDDLLSEFLTETGENLDIIDVELVRFEREPNNAELLTNIFRLVHTIKGTCGFLNLPKLETLAHAAETLMGKFRDGAEVTSEAVTLVLESIDRIKEIMAILEATEIEPEESDEALITRLKTMAGATTVAIEDADQTASVDADQAASASPASASPASVDPQPKPAKLERRISSQSIRVHVDTLENLMTMISELVLARNQLLEMVRQNDDSEFKTPLHNLSNITAELQEEVMKTRMQPVGNAWQKMPRVVRDLSHELGKKINLEMIGAEVELDRQVLELIKDPLTHMIRNSADHGLESTAERLAAGKPETGRIMLSARHEGGHIIIEISDDGKGLDTEKIKQKTLANKLVSQADLDKMSPQQIYKLIFTPGLSTADSVTNISGRGVGMDVVRTNIEQLGGSIDVRSRAGKGTTFIIKIPLTLVIISALIVESAGHYFAIPQLNVIELIRTRSKADYKIEKINQTPILRLRDRLLPLIYLDETLKLERTGNNNFADPDSAVSKSRFPDKEDIFIIVLQVGSTSFGVAVDRVYDTEEIVVKPMSSVLRDIELFSGNTILGDGSVIMIIDPNGIAQTITDEAVSSAYEETQKTEQPSHPAREQTAMLLFRAGGPELKAVPLSLITRLEEIDVNTIEPSGGRKLVQYRGRLMPLLSLHDDQQWRSEGNQPVLVFTERDRAMGLVVDEIVDIVEGVLNIEVRDDQAQGCLGSAVIDTQITEVIDVGYFLTKAFSDWFTGNASSAATGRGRRLLLVDDSAFFRNMLAPLLNAAGYDVTLAKSAREALAMKEDGVLFDVIISDIEMPEIDGFSFAESLKNDAAWGDVPLLALFSKGSQANIERSKQAGFIDCVAKFDRESLIEVLQETLHDAEEVA